ncbi:hypothetical protein VKT23_016294 [Stygiomarasmius scandens]|uniref:AB hydrolase-1 domain-containing protein n=1 Tax=Marasmiellus scandens TaxID=2682957 RepID=A0ABR1IXF3_9AGAR
MEESGKIEFFFEDSGALDTENYTTFFIIHGHTYHSGIFKRLLPPAQLRLARVILVNRREYAGSTSYNAEELKIFAEGSDQEQLDLLLHEGLNLARLLAGLIQSLSLPKSGGVALVGWSLGCTFMLSMLAAVRSLPQRVRDRLAEFIKTVILWDTAIKTMGMDSPVGAPVLKLYDENISPKDRADEFHKWVTSYFVHGNSEQHDISQLNYHIHNANKRRTFEDLPLEELLKLIDPTAGAKCDTIISMPTFDQPVQTVVNQALFDHDIRSAWANAKVWCIHGSESAWTVPLASWVLEDKSKEVVIPLQNAQPAINFAVIQGANHFYMWDDPEGSMDQLEFCIKN